MSPRKLVPFLKMLPRLEAYEALTRTTILSVALGNWPKGKQSERKRIIRQWERLAGINKVQRPREKQSVATHLENMRSMGFTVITGSPSLLVQRQRM